MTILSKIKTLIEYAKYGEVMCRRHNWEVVDEVFFPRPITQVDNTVRYYYRRIKGYVKKVTDATGFFDTNSVIEEVDLPFCNSFSVNSAHGSSGGDTVSNNVVKIIKLPSLRMLQMRHFKNLQALEYMEVGAITSCHASAFNNCKALKEFYVGKNTTGSLFLQDSPELTQECLHKIIENYADMTGAAAPTFQIGEENLAKIDDEHIAMLNEKNINYK